MHARASISGKLQHLGTQGRKTARLSRQSELIQRVEIFPHHRERLAVGIANHMRMTYAEAKNDTQTLGFWQFLPPCRNLGGCVLPNVENPSCHGQSAGSIQKPIDVSRHIAANPTRNPQRRIAKLVKFGGRVRSFYLSPKRSSSDQMPMLPTRRSAGAVVILATLRR